MKQRHDDTMGDSGVGVELYEEGGEITKWEETEDRRIVGSDI